MSVAENNWAGSYAYRAPVLRPGSVAEVQEMVAAHGQVRALGSRHPFPDPADGDGVPLHLTGLPPDVDLDRGPGTGTVSVGAPSDARYEALQP